MGYNTHLNSRLADQQLAIGALRAVCNDRDRKLTTLRTRITRALAALDSGDADKAGVILREGE